MNAFANQRLCAALAQSLAGGANQRPLALNAQIHALLLFVDALDLLPSVT
jgi:hypothetical protein